jgi:hypothetical protein
MQITLCQFEQIDGLMSSLLRMGEFETCADPVGYVRADNRLYGALVDALGMVFVDDFATSLECAASVVAAALLGTCEVLDAEAA